MLYNSREHSIWYMKRFVDYETFAPVIKPTSYKAVLYPREKLRPVWLYGLKF
jgi:hypothetical protein